MSLTVKFYGWGLFKTHVIINDSCNVEISSATPEIREIQRGSVMLQYAKGTLMNLLYMNKGVVDEWVSSDGKIDLHCPVCKKDYSITKREYETAWQRYQQEQKSRRS